MAEEHSTSSVPKDWWNQRTVDPGWFGTLPLADAVQVLWNLTAAHGDAIGLIRGLEARRQAETDKTITSMLADI